MSWPETRFTQLIELLSARTGIAFPAQRRSFVEGAVRRAMAKARVPNLSTYTGRVVAEAELLSALISEVTVNETYFFRDTAQFESIRTTVIPELLRAKGEGGNILAWSAGCASGEEAYSLAITLEELGLENRSRVVATDLSQAALDKARRSIYGAWSFRGEARPWQSLYFSRAFGRWTIAPRFRSRVDFREHNLVGPPTGLEPCGVDLILCRNVLMYFDRESIARAARGLVQALAPGGWLILGAADPMLPAMDGLEVVPTPAGVMYRRPASAWFVPAAQSFPEPPPAPTLGYDDAPLTVLPASAPAFAPAALPARENAAAAAARIRSLTTDGEREHALHELDDAVVQHPLEIELHVLRSLLMLEAGRPGEAAIAARSALFLDRFLAVGHLVLGKAMRLTGRRRLAERALHRCSEILAELPEHEEVRFAHGVSVRNLVASAAAELRILDRTQVAR